MEALGGIAGAGGALASGAGRSEAGTQTAPPSGSRIAALTGGALEGARAGASAFPAARNVGRVAGGAVGFGAATLGLGLGVMGGAYEGARYFMGGGNGGDAAVSSEDQARDIRTLNNMQQGTPQRQISLRAPRVQQPMVSRMDADSDDAPMAQQQSQPRPQVQSRPTPLRPGRRIIASNVLKQQRRKQTQTAKAERDTGALLQRSSQAGTGARGGVICLDDRRTTRRAIGKARTNRKHGGCHERRQR